MLNFFLWSIIILYFYYSIILYILLKNYKNMYIMFLKNYSINNSFSFFILFFLFFYFLILKFEIIINYLFNYYLFIYLYKKLWGERVSEPHVNRYKPHIFEMAYYI